MMCLIAGRASLECQMSSIWPRRNFLVGMVSFWYRFYKSKKSGADSVRLGSSMAATNIDIFV